MDELEGRSTSSYRRYRTKLRQEGRSASEEQEDCDSRVVPVIDRDQRERSSSLEEFVESPGGTILSGGGKSKVSKSFSTHGGGKVNISIMRCSTSEHSVAHSGGNKLRLDFSRLGSMNDTSGMDSSSSVVSGSGSSGNSPQLHVVKGSGGSQNFKATMSKYSGYMQQYVNSLRSSSRSDKSYAMEEIYRLVRQAWNTPNVGRDLAYGLCDVLRNSGGLDALISNCGSSNTELRFLSAQALEQCMSTENRNYVVEKGLQDVVQATCAKGDLQMGRVGSGILENLFKHSEETCTKVVKLGGLDTILSHSRSQDNGTLRHCAAAFSNLALYGGCDNHELMIARNVPEWLYPLAFSKDDSTRYYACLAICCLVANKAVQTAVKKSGTLDLVEPFLLSHDPVEFADFDEMHRHGRSKEWLQRLLPALMSSSEEARALVAFHFAMEASIKKKQGRLDIFYEIGAIDALKQVASSPNKLGCKYASEALRIIGEEVPHKLSLQVPLWSVEDVLQWVKQIGYEEYIGSFRQCRVDGDLLLTLTDEMLREDVGMGNGILRKRFLRELTTLKINADYSSCDATGLDVWILWLQTDLSQYSYHMLQQGVCKEMLPYLTEDHLRNDCGITNGVHRLRILQAVRTTSTVGMTPLSSPWPPSIEVARALDVFISYRRSSGSQLASLLKVHLQLRGFRVFIDVERLEAGKFDMNLLTSIKSSKNFVLVLTPRALDRCIQDHECKDWVHKEVRTALECDCSIIPVLDGFEWPEADSLPEDMRAVCYFNGIRWIHDYQEACVDKLERFLKGELNPKSDVQIGNRHMNIHGAPPALPEPSRGSTNSSASNESSAVPMPWISLPNDDREDAEEKSSEKTSNVNGAL